MTTPSIFREYIWLVEQIYKSGKISLRELSDRWRDTEMSGGVDLPRTTFNRHRDAIADIFGVFIECDRSSRKYYIMNSHMLEEDTVQNWMLTTLSVNNLISESMSVQNRIILEGIPSEGKNLSMMIEAMKKSVKICIHYQKYGETEITSRIVEPYCIKLYHRRWYLLAKNDKHEFRVFSFDRIKDVEEQKEKFKIDKDFDAKEYFENCFGVVNQIDMAVQKVVLRAFRNEANYMRDLPIHPSQKEIAIGDDYSDFELFLKPSIDFQGHILSRSMMIKVLEPQWLVDAIKKSLAAMTALYY